MNPVLAYCILTLCGLISAMATIRAWATGLDWMFFFCHGALLAVVILLGLFKQTPQEAKP